MNNNLIDEERGDVQQIMTDLEMQASLSPFNAFAA